MTGATKLFEKFCKFLRRILVVPGMSVVLASGAVEGQTILPDPVEGREVEMGSQAGLDAWVEGFRVRALEAGVSASTFDAAMRGVAFNPA
jgi:membrane-bound lytic murein transglycosylase B